MIGINLGRLLNNQSAMPKLKSHSPSPRTPLNGPSANPWVLRSQRAMGAGARSALKRFWMRYPMRARKASNSTAPPGPGLGFFLISGRGSGRDPHKGGGRGYPPPQWGDQGRPPPGGVPEDRKIGVQNPTEKEAWPGSSSPNTSSNTPSGPPAMGDGLKSGSIIIYVIKNVSREL